MWQDVHRDAREGQIKVWVSNYGLHIVVNGQGIVKNGREWEAGGGFGGCLRLQTSNSNSQPIRLEVAVCISKCPRKGFSTIKKYHSHSNSFHHSDVCF